jgi:hypothetical protein
MGQTGEEWLPLTHKIKKEYSEFYGNFTAFIHWVAEEVVLYGSQAARCVIKIVEDKYPAYLTKINRIS